MAVGSHQSALFDYLVCLGDDHLILGHRLSEWCGHGPMLEEDLALSNISLDMFGQARSLFTYAGEIEGKGRDEDALAFLRKEHEYRNLMLVERPNGDFAQTILRQLFYSLFAKLLWEALSISSDKRLAAIAQKAVKESSYHVRHSAEWVIRLGDGTSLSADRLENAVTTLAPNIEEMFTNNDNDAGLVESGIIPTHENLRDPWRSGISEIFERALLDIKKLDVHPIQGARQGRHSEAMGHILAELQYMQRTYPGCEW